MKFGNEVDVPVLKISVITILVLAVLFGAFGPGCKAYNRYQTRADAQNRVKVTHIEIRRAEQQAQINRAQIAATKAEAQKRREEAKGIRDAQKTIDKTLTPLYLQHEAIQAQKAIATSGENNTVIYVPSGANGTPSQGSAQGGLSQAPVLTAEAGKGK